MKAFVYTHTTLIGETDLRPGDTGMGGLYGTFQPNDYYYWHVRPLVRRLWAGKPDHKEWQALRLNVQLENGCFLAPSGGYSICDLAALPDDPVTINIAGVHYFIIEDFFKTDPPQRFLLDPWDTIGIEQKISLENELARELKREGNAAQQRTAGNRHVLADYECSAFARDIRSDDVLFAVHNRMYPANQFAMVHLTWNPERTVHWPETSFFESFGSFKEEQMYPDASEYEP